MKLPSAPLARRSRAFSLLEVVVSSAILGVLLLATASLLVTLQRGTAHTTASVDMGQDVRRVLQQLRREVRQSGYRIDPVTGADSDAPVQITAGTPNDKLVLRLRTDFLTEKSVDVAFSSDSERFAYNWGRWVTYETAASDTVPKPGGTVQRYRLLKTVQEYDRSSGKWVTAMNKAPICDGLESFSVEAVAGDDGVATTSLNGGEELRVVLVACRTNPDWSGSSTPEPLRLKIEERLRVYNRHSHPDLD